ncbi:hypothetical protein J4E93_006418 [Alternaria ventricosa]|uniref:uncharacterized protein n=1 Tax=Alternaria ventricosa TaxID=1187951 RepID=UPI0020C412E7|nr:uncharacterized protein J4E93_006418 [Alternaria ventricosa]KAI4644513.1 hypothetical protein J4E93_006418 [Alternaria ventricosa]
MPHVSDGQVVIGNYDIGDVEAASDDEGSGNEDDAGSADDSSDTESSSDEDEDATNNEYDIEGEEANSDQDSDSEEDASDVEDAIDDEVDYNEDEDMEKPTNIFNPSGSRVNYTDMGQSYASGLSNEYSPPASDSGRRDLDEWTERLEENGFETSDDLPDEEYLSGAREASVAYWHANGGGHVVAMDGGYNDATYTYSDHQGRVDEDVTEEVNKARREDRIAGYITRPDSDDREREQQQEDDYEDDEEEAGGDEDYGDDGDYEMDNGWNKYR